jgi:multidrug resistance efflux pump
VRRRLAVLAVLALVAVGAVALRARDGARPLVLSGAVEARTIEVGSLLGGRVAAVRAEEGARVAAGDTLVTFETDLLDPQIAEQEARLARARATLARVERGPRTEEIERARIEFEAAETDRKRLEPLLAQGSIGQREYDAALVRVATRKEILDELRRGSRVEEVDEARAAVAGEEARLAQMNSQRDEAVVRAPASGVIEALDLRPGDLVAAGKPVASLLEEGQLWVRVYVPEPRLGLVHAGQAAAITVDTFPGREFAGRVVEIRDEGEYTPRNIQTLEQRADQVFGVKIAIDPTPDLKPGMAALVRLLP